MRRERMNWSAGVPTRDESLFRGLHLEDLLFPTTPYLGTLHDCWWEAELDTSHDRPHNAALRSQGCAVRCRR